MPSERARTALFMRRSGVTYRQIGEHLGVTPGRGRQLVMQALRAEGRRAGHRQPTEQALESIKYYRRRPLV